MSPESYVSYFEGIARKHAAIQHGVNDEEHFLRFVDDEVRTGMVAGVSDPVMVLEDVEYSFSHNGGDGFFESPVGGFFIVYQVDKGDSAAEYAAYHNGHKVAKEILLRMYSDSKNKNSPMWRAFNFEGSTIQQLGPVYDNYYGSVTRFSLKSPVGRNVDPATWTDL